MGFTLQDFPSKEFLITDYGAVVSDRLQTGAIQAAIDACFLAGGGRVVIPAGIYLTGGLRLRSNVALYLKSGAILRGSSNHEDYDLYRNDTLEPIGTCDEEHQGKNPYSRWNNGLIKALNAKNIAIVGEEGSYIDGNDCYDPTGEEKYRGPHGINIWDCENILLEGYTLMNSANWAQAIFRSRISLPGI